jgi:hypothetical protein
MAQFNENITLASPNPLDKRYLSNRTSGGSQLPYSSVTEVYVTIPTTVRYSGLTVLVQSGVTNVEYWFEQGISNSDLIQKKYATIIPLGNFVTGGTNIGFFSGFTGVQTLNISTLAGLGVNYLDYWGNYQSLYNYYFRDTSQVIRIGTPSDNISKRGYLKTSAIPAQVKSWIWDDNHNGWSLIDGNISLQLGTTQPAVLYYPPATAYTQTVWTTGVANGSDVIINSVSGSLTSGSPITIGGPVFGCMAHNNLHFRTLMTKSPNTLSVAYDEAFFYVSGITSIINGQNVGTGVAVLKVPTGQTLQFRRLLGSGNTTVTQVGDTIIINSIGGSGGTTGGTGTITGATNGLYVTGKKIGLGGTLCQNTNINGVAAYDLNVINIDQFEVDTAGSIGQQVILGLNPAGVFMEFCGTAVDLSSNRGLEYQGNYSANFSNCSLITKEYAQSLVASGSTYNLSSPAAVCVGGICVGTVLTGKTSFQLFEELLVPELFQTSVGTPTTSVNATLTGTLEIGCNFSQTITPTYTPGTITPLYCSTSPFCRGGAANDYSYAGPSLSTGFFGCTSCNIPSYTVTSGAQTWCVCTKYNAGSCIKGSKGTVNPTYPTICPLNSCTANGTASITGILPWYWGTSASGTITGPTVAGGTKTIATVGSSTPIIFNAVTQFLWFAAPTGTYTTKTKWWVCAANAGIIGGTGELWKQQGTVAVTSISGCWAGCSFDVYVTCGITTTAVGVPMCLYF